MIRIGTRGSKLALIQANMVKRRLEDIGIESLIVEIESLGDFDHQSPIYKMGSIGVFVENLNKKILDNEIDCAVHSAKDIPSSIPEELNISAVLPRDNPSDALVSDNDLFHLKEGSVVGTSSLRRIKGLLNIRTDLRIQDIRGNIDTRIGKLNNGSYDALVVATCALKRLGITQKYHEFSLNSITPAANQGIIAVVSRNDESVTKPLSAISHTETMKELRAERTILSLLGLGCSEPVGIFARSTPDKLYVVIRFYNKNGDGFKEFNGIVGSNDAMQDLMNEIMSGLPQDFGYEL